MRFVEWFLSNLGEILCNYFILSRFILEIGEFVRLTDYFDYILEFHSFSDFLNVDS